ncbi:MAG TPA: response regulator [Burkholderiaceae bacterium]|nr:response regulator [Burkholderiaceae bacterium]
MSPRVLLVEDNEVNRYLVRFVLEQAGFVVDVAVDGAQALERARQALPDLILMDLRMPVLDGYEATLRLKADPALRAVPVAALSAQAMPHEIARALEVGCVAHFDKPIDVRRFAEQVRALLASHPR